MIKKQNFPESFLQKHAASERSFTEGQALFRDSSAVHGPVGNEKDHSIHYLIHDQKNEKVQVYFYNNGLNKSYSCTCDFFQKHDGLCRHVIAALLDLNTYESENIPMSQEEAQEARQVDSLHSKNDAVVNQLLDNYWKETQVMSASLNKETLNIEYSLRIKGSEKVAFYVMTMKAGMDYLYVVQDIEQITSDLLNQKEIEFGSRLTYHPDHHRISTEDRKMLHLIKDIIQLMQSSSPGRGRSSHNELFIPPEMAKRVIRQLLKVDAGFLYNEFSQSAAERSAPVYVKEEFEHIPLSFSIKKSKDNFYSFGTSKQNMSNLRLFNRADMIYFENTFYFLNRQQYQVASYLKDAFQSLNGEEMIMNKEQFSLFASNALPQIRGLFSVTMDQELHSSILTPPLQAQLYIDWRDEELFVRPAFRYLNQMIYPFESSSERLMEDDQVVVRDLSLENEKIELLADNLSSFEHEDGFAKTDQLIHVSHFLYHALQELAEHFVIMMTEPAQHILYEPENAPHLRLEVSASSNLLDVSFELEDIPEEDIQDLVQALSVDRSYYRLSNGKILDLKDRAFDQFNHAVKRLDLPGGQVQKEMQVPLYKGLALDEKDSVEWGRHFSRLVEELKAPDQLEFPLPKSLDASLRSYQETGYKWLRTLDYYGLGAVLADDMGLGKTLQTIAFLASKIEEGKEPFLVISPASVLYNWEHEFSKFTPDLETIIISGTKEERATQVQQALDEKIPILITSYPLIQRDGDLYSDITFSSMILDESQYVKNMNTKTAKAVRNIKRQHAVALSGTPIENHLGELYSLFSIVMPGLFESPSHFKSLTKQEISEKIRPFILRRLKSEVLFDLPEKTESTEYIELAKEQKQLYQTQIDLLKEEVKTYIDEDKVQSNRMSILAGLTRLRQICNDPRLVLQNYEGDSAKLLRVLELLEEAKENGKRVVLFSQFTKMLGLIRRELDALGYDYHYLDGMTKPKDRLDLANRFNMGEKDLFLISLKAGGTGLNLTGGDTVILYDSWWNPAIEDQAADRVHRFGQKKSVQVIRMISKGTIEERIYEMQEAKRELVDSVITSEAEQDSATLTKEELLALIDL